MTGWRERPPDILAGLDPGAFAIRIGDGLAIAPATRRFTRQYWLRNAGLAEPVLWPGGRGPGDAALSCDGIGCILRRGGTTVAVVLDRAALQEDCHEAELLIAAMWVARWRCRAPERVIDLRERRREGALAIWLEPDGPRIESARQLRGARPWTAQYWRNRQTSRP